MTVTDPVMIWHLEFTGELDGFVNLTFSYNDNVSSRPGGDYRRAFARSGPSGSNRRRSRWRRDGLGTLTCCL